MTQGRDEGGRWARNAQEDIHKGEVGIKGNPDLRAGSFSWVIFDGGSQGSDHSELTTLPPRHDPANRITLGPEPSRKVGAEGAGVLSRLGHSP